MQDDKLKKLLQGADVPEPSDEGKQRALHMAAQAFEIEQEKKRKGTTESIRPIPSESIVTAWIRSFNMKKAYVFAGSFAAVAVVLAVTTTHYTDILNEVTPKQTSVDQLTVMPNQDLTASQPPMEMERANTDKEVVASASDAIDMKAPGMAGEGSVAASSPSPMPLAKSESRSLGEHYVDTVVKRGKIAQEAVQGNVRVSNAAPGMAASSPYPYNIITPYPPQPQYYGGGDRFEQKQANLAKSVANEPVSTFSIDVDTASYSFVRRMLTQGSLPQPEMVRVEEMVNYFSYNYALPQAGADPFKPSITVAPSPWNSAKKLVHIGIKGYDVQHATRPAANLVFLIDVSGSMNSPDKLPLVKSSLHMLVDQMNEKDTISIVTYAGYAGTALSPTNGSNKQAIRSVIDMLGAGGSTAGAAGIEQAYTLAQQHFNKEGVNRVILATDGDFNVGMSNDEQLKTYITQKREGGISLSVLGFGQGNYNDALMQALAQNGNGNAAYIDNLNEARKVLVDEMGSTLFTIAKDVKIQLEWNPALVSEYRLVGYETRLLNREDFNNDKVDAGEVGAGHAVTAIYEITPKGVPGSADPLRYGAEQKAEETKPATEFSGEYGFLKIRYKKPEGTESTLMTTPINAALEVASIEQASPDVRFAAAVAGFGQLLKQDPAVSGLMFDGVITLADGARGNDAHGLRAEFVNLVRTAKSLQTGVYPNPVEPMHRCGPGQRC